MENIKIGITTDFNEEHMSLGIDILGRYGVHIDSAVSTSRLTKVMGTNSDMIKLNMKQMGIDDPKHILKMTNELKSNDVCYVKYEKREHDQMAKQIPF